MLCPCSLFPRPKIRITIVGFLDTWMLTSTFFVVLSPILISSLAISIYTGTHSTPKHKKSHPQLHQAISLTVQSVFFPMMVPIGTGKRTSDLLPHRAHAFALIWKMISVLLEPINIILVSPVNDTFLPSIVDLTEEEMSVRREEEEERKGRESSRASHTTREPFTPSNCILTSKTVLSPFLIHTCKSTSTKLINH